MDISSRVSLQKPCFLDRFHAVNNLGLVRLVLMEFEIFTEGERGEGGSVLPRCIEMNGDSRGGLTTASITPFFIIIAVLPTHIVM